MALTPEDVVGKTFLPTRFQEGYNQDEVDDFLDEVVATLRDLQQENAELRARLSCDQEAPDSPAAPAPAGPSGADHSSSAAGVLALAQRLHDEHIAAGQKQRDTMLAEARERADALVGEAEQVRATTLSSLERERDQLQAWIDSLRALEHEYRGRLTSFLQAQLDDLATRTSLEPEHSGT